MIRNATIESQSIRFVFDNDADALAFISAIAARGATYQNQTIPFSAPHFPIQLNSRRFNVARQMASGTGDNNAAVTLAIPANDVNGEFFYEDLRQILGKLPALHGKEAVESLLQQGRGALQANRTVFIPNQENPRFEVEMSDECRLTFNQQHSDYDPVRAAKCTSQIGNKFGPDKLTPQTDGFRMNYANIDEMGPLNYHYMGDMNRLSLLTMRLMEYDFLAPSESADFIQSIRAQRISLLAAHILNTAKINSGPAHGRNVGDEQPKMFQEVFTRIAQDHGFHTLSLAQLQTLSDIGEGGVKGREALRQLLPGELYNPLLISDIPSMMANFRQEIVAQRRAMLDSSVPAETLRTAGVTISEPPRGDPDLLDLIRKLEQSVAKSRHHTQQPPDRPRAEH